MAKVPNTTFPREGPCSAGESLTVAAVGEKSSSVATVCPTYTGGAPNAIESGSQRRTEKEEEETHNAVRRSARFKRPETPKPLKQPPKRSATPASSVVSTDMDSEDYDSDGYIKERPTRTKGQRELQVVLDRYDLKSQDDAGLDDHFFQALADRKRRSTYNDEDDVSSNATDIFQPAEMGVEDLRAEAFRLASNIVQTAHKSSNIKGTCQKMFKDSATGLMSIVSTMANRTDSTENRRLHGEVRELRAEVDRLKAEVESGKREFQKLLDKAMSMTPAPAPEPVASEAQKMEDIIRSAMEEAKSTFASTISTLIDARMANLEQRLPPPKAPRPPLTRHPEVTPHPAPSQESWATVAKKNKAKKKNTETPKVPAPPTLESTPATPNTALKETARKRKKKKKSRVARPRAPAVVITMQPQAAETGATYAKLLERAAEAINLAELGITEGLKVRKTTTGARILELNKKDDAKKADDLAQRLKGVLSDVAVITRPVTMLDVRITGLDDTVTKEEIAAAIEKLGKCSAQQVRVSDIRIGPGGVGMTMARCPAAAAKALEDAGRLLVRWSAAKIVVLKKLPLRCFRCLGLGHTATLCPSSKSRESLCFRCGREGHKSAACKEPPHCAVCADAGKPCGHVMGGQACRPPPVKGKLVSPAAGHAGESPMSVG